MRNKAIKRIRFISYVLLTASILAIGVGLFTVGKGGISLIVSNNELSVYETNENITLIAEGLVLIIHYYFVSRFLMTSLKEGVPLTFEGARELRILGWETILLPLLVMILRIFLFAGIIPISELLKIEIYETILGVFIILAGYVNEYAAIKIEKGHTRHLMCKKLQDKYPEIFYELENEMKGETE